MRYSSPTGSYDFSKGCNTFPKRESKWENITDNTQASQMEKECPSPIRIPIVTFGLVGTNLQSSLLPNGTD